MDCPRCGGDIQEEEAAFCPHCGSRLFAGPEGRTLRPPGETGPGGTAPPEAPPLAPPPGGGPTAEAPEERVPFEDPSLSFPSRLLGTIRAAFLQPGALFARLAPGGLGLPLLYGLIVGVLGWIFWGLWYPPTRDWAIEAAREMPPEMQGGGLLAQMLESALSDAEVRTWVLLSPFITVVTIFAAAGFIHLTLVLLGGGERGFRVTLRAVCYGSTPALLMIVPFCGQYVAGIWSLVLMAVGLARGHRSAGWQAAFAVIIPVFFSCCLFAGLNTLALLGGGGLGG